MSEDKVTVIVPIYNSERVLDRCIRSILSQTFHNIELILVDDGSTDNSLEICEKYKRIDERVIVITQNNRGVSSARNAGIRVCSGKYLTFVDSDDALQNDAIEKVVGYIKKYNTDVVIYGWKVINEKTSSVQKFMMEEEIINDNSYVIQRILQNYSDYGGGYPWNKLWRVETVRKNKVIPEFDIDLFYFEDLEWVIKMMCCIKKMVIYPECLYQYYIMENSITHSDSKKEQKELSYHKAINKTINCLSETEKLQTWFKTKYMPEVVNGVIDATRKKHSLLKSYLFEQMILEKDIILKSPNICFKIKLRYIYLLILKRLNLL